MSVLYFIALMIISCAAEVMFTNDFNFRVEPGGRTCFFEAGKAGQMMEVYYQVVDGQHGDLDISLDVIDPTGTMIVSDYKKSENSIIRDLTVDGDYAFCLDNTFSIMNSKLVFVYVMFEDQNATEAEPETEAEATVTVLDENGVEVKQVEALHWMGTDESDQEYYIPIDSITESMSRTLKNVVQARHMLDMYAASKSRDSYSASESTFVVDTWSGAQITCMCVVGMVQVYMIKNLFKSPRDY